ncbi:MAG: hypothetical protein KZQ96_07045 [Candidatus Thiodiazotropha sp. (ex Lucinoma borealis)]|nr:hypothetical protein [Candidatus Thiodiazotropha sp. (ex Lucinoma borealis)]
MGELCTEHRTIGNPVLHDSGGNFDREVRYPNDDPAWNAQQLETYIDRSTAQDGILGTIVIGAYDNWLNQNRGVDVLR